VSEKTAWASVPDLRRALGDTDHRQTLGTTIHRQTLGTTIHPQTLGDTNYRGWDKGAARSRAAGP